MAWIDSGLNSVIAHNSTCIGVLLSGMNRVIWGAMVTVVLGGGPL